MLPKSCSVPSLMVTVPVSRLTALRISLPAPFLVMPPVDEARKGVEIVSVSPAAFVRKTKSAAPPLVMPVPPVIVELNPPVCRMPPETVAAPFCKVSVCAEARVSVRAEANLMPALMVAVVWPVTSPVTR